MFKFNDIYNEDTYEAMQHIPDKSIDLIIADPLYEFDTGGGGGAFGAKRRNYRAEYEALYHKEGFTKEAERLRVAANKQEQKRELHSLAKGFEYDVLHEFDRVMKKINIYLWCSMKQLSAIINHYEGKGCNVKVMFWGKTNSTPTCNNTYLNDIEYLIFAREKGVKVYGNYHTKSGYYISPANTADKKLFKHPTIKPLERIKHLVINSSVENDVVFDPFIGSGTTAVAAKELNRQYLGFEIRKDYFEIAKKRINGITAHGQTSIFTDFENIE